MTTADALTAVDEALASDRAAAADPMERELQEIALALRADAPEPDAGFARQLDDRVARRFAKPRAGRSRLPRRRLVLAGAASLLAVVAVAGAVAGLTGGGGERRTVEPAAAPSRKQARHPVPATASGAAPGFTMESGGAPRRVERSAELTLAAPSDDLDHVADQVVKVTDRHRGVVIDSSVSTGSDSSKGGSFSLRVPTSELTATMRDLSRLGEVRARSQSGHDVTRTYNSTADRLAATRVERRGLLRRLAHATTTSDADRIRARLDRLNLEIHSLRNQLGTLQSRTGYTRIHVTVVEQRSAASPLRGTGDALRGSLRALVGALAITLRVIAAVIPFALLAALAWAAAAQLRRRRREAALS